MIAEEQQEQVALHALGLLPADEAESLEEELGTNPELATLGRELRDAAGFTVLGLAPVAAPAGVRSRVLAQVAQLAAESRGPAARRVTAFRPAVWLPWALAAALAIYCGVLATDRTDLRRELAAARTTDPLSQIAVYSLDPAGNPSRGAVSVAWAPGHQNGLVDVNGLAAPGSDKDYQLWAVDSGSKTPISAGLVKINDKGHARVFFKPAAAAEHVAAFAISVEPAGGSASKTGPIVFVGAE